MTARLFGVLRSLLKFRKKTTVHSLLRRTISSRNALRPSKGMHDLIFLCIHASDFVVEAWGAKINKTAQLTSTRCPTDLSGMSFSCLFRFVPVSNYGRRNVFSTVITLGVRRSPINSVRSLTLSFRSFATQDLFWITTSSGKTMHAHCTNAQLTKKRQGVSPSYNEFESPKRYEVNIDQRPYQDTEAAEGCFKWSLKLDLPFDKTDPSYLHTGAVVRLSFLDNKGSTVFCQSTFEGEGAQPFLVPKSQMTDTDPQCIFVVESANKISDFVRWRTPYKFRHLLSGKYLSTDLSRPSTKSGTWRSLLRRETEDESSISTKFKLIPATSDEQDGLIRRDSAIGWLSIEVPLSEIEAKTKVAENKRQISTSTKNNLGYAPGMASKAVRRVADGVAEQGIKIMQGGFEDVFKSVREGGIFGGTPDERGEETKELFLHDYAPIKKDRSRTMVPL